MGDRQQSNPAETEARAAIDALQLRERLLETRLRPSRKGAPASQWTLDASVRRVMSLTGEPRREAKHLLLEAASDVLRTVGVQMVIDDHDIDEIDRVAELSQSTFVPLRAIAIQALGRLGAHRTMHLIAAALEDEAVFWAAAEALALLGGEGAPQLLQQALGRFDDPWDRLDIIMLMGDVGGQWVVPILEGILQDSQEPFPPARGYAAQILAMRSGADALPRLIQALHDPSLVEKGRVIWSIGATRAPAGYDAVAAYFEAADKDWWRVEALRAMAQCDPSRAAQATWLAATTADDFRADAELFRDVLFAMASARPDGVEHLLTDALRAALGDPLDRIAAESRVHGGWSVPDVVVHAGPRFVVNLLETLCQVFGVEPEPLTGRHSPAAIAHHKAQALLEHVLRLGRPDLVELEMAVGRLATD